MYHYSSFLIGSSAKRKYKISRCIYAFRPRGLVTWYKKLQGGHAKNAPERLQNKVLNQYFQLAVAKFQLKK